MRNGMQRVSISMNLLLVGAGYGRILVTRVKIQPHVSCYTSIFPSVSIMLGELYIPCHQPVQPKKIENMKTEEAITGKNSAHLDSMHGMMTLFNIYESSTIYTPLSSPLIRQPRIDTPGPGRLSPCEWDLSGNRDRAAACTLPAVLSPSEGDQFCKPYLESGSQVSTRNCWRSVPRSSPKGPGPGPRRVVFNSIFSLQLRTSVRLRPYVDVISVFSKFEV